MPDNSQAPRLRAEMRASVPATPGVYILKGADGRPIYVGKSRNLRNRMLSYVGSGQTAQDSHIRHLAYAIRAFEYRETPSELTALLLEDVLIKRLDPPANTRQRDYRERVYVTLTDDTFPALSIVGPAESQNGVLFGPFRDKHFALRLIGLIQQHFQLRSCRDREPFRKSANYEIGFCLGPCRGAVSPAEYQIAVEGARAFLEGDTQWILPRLRSAMDERARLLQFERAAQIRATIQFCERFAERQRFGLQFRTGSVEALDTTGRSVRHRFHRGRLDLLEVDGVPVQDTVPAELWDALEDERWVQDRADLVFDWLNHHLSEEV